MMPRRTAFATRASVVLALTIGSLAASPVQAATVAGVTPGALGKRETFADIGQSIAAFFDLAPMDYGTSFLAD